SASLASDIARQMHGSQKTTRRETQTYSNGDGSRRMSCSTEAQNLATARRFLEVLEGGEEANALAQFLHPEIVQKEYPNRLAPRGVRRDRAALLQSVAQGRRLFQPQQYEVRSAVAEGCRVALEVVWSGTLLAGSPAASVLRSHTGVFLEFQEGRIVALRNYDCLDPW